MARAFINPVIGRMLLGYGAAVPAAAYAGAAGIFIITSISTPAGHTPFFTIVISLVVAVLIMGTIGLPFAFLAGLPAFLLAVWLAVGLGVRSAWGFCLMGISGSAFGTFLILPLFRPLTASVSRNLFETSVLKDALEGFVMLAPAGLLAGWIFWYVSHGRPAANRMAPVNR